MDFYSYSFRYCLTGILIILWHVVWMSKHRLFFPDWAHAYFLEFTAAEEKQKSIDIESICELLDLVLGSQFHAQVDYFIEYLKVGCNNYCIFPQRLQLLMLSVLDFLNVTVYTCTSSSVIMGNEFISVLAERIP